jgi:hypothetical protein
MNSVKTAAWFGLAAVILIVIFMVVYLSTTQELDPATGKIKRSILGMGKKLSTVPVINQAAEEGEGQ